MKKFQSQNLVQSYNWQVNIQKTPAARVWFSLNIIDSRIFGENFCNNNEMPVKLKCHCNKRFLWILAENNYLFFFSRPPKRPFLNIFVTPIYFFRKEIFLVSWGVRYTKIGASNRNLAIWKKGSLKVFGVVIFEMLLAVKIKVNYIKVVVLKYLSVIDNIIANYR